MPDDDRSEAADPRAQHHPRAAADRAEPDRRGQHRQALRPAREDAVGKAGEEFDKAARANRRHDKQEQQRPDAGMAGGVGVGLDRGADRVLPLEDRLMRKIAQLQERDLEGDVADRVGRERRGDADLGDQDSGNRRPDEAGKVEEHRVDR